MMAEAGSAGARLIPIGRYGQTASKVLVTVIMLTREP